MASRVCVTNFCARIGQALGQLGQDAQPFVEFADRQEPRINYELTAVEGDGDLLRPEVPQRKLFQAVCRHDFEPPCGGKLSVSCNLHTQGGSFFKNWVRNSG